MDTPPPSPLQPPVPSGGPSDSQWKTILHLCPLCGLIIPLGNVIAPLIIWLLKKAESPALDPVGRSVLNFQISYSIYAIASTIIAVVGSCLIIPMFLPLVVLIAWLILTIIGGVKASSGEDYAYPLTIKML